MSHTSLHGVPVCSVNVRVRCVWMLLLVKTDAEELWPVEGFSTKFLRTKWRKLTLTSGPQCGGLHKKIPGSVPGGKDPPNKTCGVTLCRQSSLLCGSKVKLFERNVPFYKYDFVLVLKCAITALKSSYFIYFFARGLLNIIIRMRNTQISILDSVSPV